MQMSICVCTSCLCFFIGKVTHFKECAFCTCASIYVRRHTMHTGKHVLEAALKMQSLMDAVNFTDGNSYRQGALNYSGDTLLCLLLFPLTLLNFTSFPSALTNYAILCKFPISFYTLPNLATTTYPAAEPIQFEYLLFQNYCPTIYLHNYLQIYKLTLKNKEKVKVTSTESPINIVETHPSAVGVS